MGPAISDILPFAVVVMTSPIPIIGVILMLFSSRARTNGPMFLLGWLVGLVLVSTIVYVVADALDVGSDADASDGASTLQVVLGIVLILLALRKWRSRPAPGETEPLPKWMAAIDSVTPGRAAVLGFLFSAVNPKNLILTVGAVLSVAKAGVSTADAVTAIAVFIVIGSLGIVIPVVGYLVGGDRVRTMLDGWKVWLEHNNAAVMSVMLLVIGVVVLSKGLGPITA
jgi:threonine/homoserine/homoserine lactone efflux protein